MSGREGYKGCLGAHSNGTEAYMKALCSGRRESKRLSHGAARLMHLPRAG